MSWFRHIEANGAKTNKTLAPLSRDCRDMCNSKTRTLLYCALVRPKLEYGSGLWSPYTMKHRVLLENVQERTTKFILNYSPNMTYNGRLIKLDLLGTPRILQGNFRSITLVSSQEMALYPLT